jgi:AcrR family transcriptional regulator
MNWIMNVRGSRVNRRSGNKRAYDGRRRQEQAARNRDAIIDAAERRFLRDGYAKTTVVAIAADVGVSDHTIYKSFRGKPGLVRAIRARALAGEGPIPAEQRSDQLHADGTDGRSIIDGWGALTAEIMPRVAPILLLLRDAAVTDPEVGELLAEMDADRLRRMTENARRLRAGGHLRRGLTVAEAADVLWTYSAPELYELLVLRRGWSPRRYGTFAAAAMADALLTP